jgi:hypothetical protein
MYFVHPVAGERFFLCFLLTVISGVTSFEHLWTVDDIEHLTFQAAYRALGLLQDDAEMGHVHVGSMYRSRRKEAKESLCDSLTVLLSFES